LWHFEIGKLGFGDGTGNPVKKRKTASTSALEPRRGTLGKLFGWKKLTDRKTTGKAEQIIF
jgi:hypothetical protein